MNELVKQQYKKKIWKHILMIFIIVSTDTLVFNTYTNSVPKMISWVLICVGAACYLMKHGINEKNRSVVIIAGILVLNMLLLQDITGGYILKIALLI